MMLLLAFAVRHFLRHWRLQLVLLVGLILAAALLAGLPAYAGVVAHRSLHERLLSHALPAERNISVSTVRPGGLNAAIYGMIEDALGDLLAGRFEVRDTTLPVYVRRPQPGEAPPPPPPFHNLRIWGFTRLSSLVRVIDGQLPVYEEPTGPQSGLRTPILQAAMGLSAAGRMGLQVGDRVSGSVALRPVVFEIVGIVEPLEPEHDRWWGDPNVFGVSIQPINANEDIVTLPLLLPPQTMRVWLHRHEWSWRIFVDADQITADNAGPVQEALTGLQTQLRTHAVTMRSGLPKILVDYQAELATARLALFLLTAQAFVFVLYTLTIITSFLLERSEGELATMVGRGGNRLQITLVFALEGLILALLAVGVGPLLTSAAVKLWGVFGEARIPPTLPAESWVLALIAAGFGWLAIVVPVYLATRRTVLEWQYRLGRPARLAPWQRLYLDLVLLALGGFIYWQLSQSGSFIMSRIEAAPMADPFLLLGSSLLLIAVAMVFLRIFPYLLGLVAWITRRGRGLVFSLGLARLARSPLGASRVVLLVSLATGLGLFTNAFVSSLGVSQTEAAHYSAGADLRISVVGSPVDAAEEVAEGLPGVLAATPVFRATLMGVDSTSIHLLAVDPDTFARVARYSAGTDRPAMSSLMRSLHDPTAQGIAPAILSRSYLTPRRGIDTLVGFTLGGQQLIFDVRDAVEDFPALPDPFVVTSYPALGEQVNLNSVYFRVGELWLSVDPARHADLVRDPRLAGRILGDGRAELRSLQADAMAQGTSGAFQLNTLVLGVLSVAGFLLVHYFAARKRTYEFGLLRAMGLAPGQVFTLLVTEGVLVVGLGLLAGTGIGYGLTQVMFPYLSQALAASLAGVRIEQIVIDWPAVLRLYGILAGCYLLAMIVLLLALVRTGLHRVLRLGEE